MTEEGGKLSEGQRQTVRQCERFLQRLIVDHDAYYLEWLRERHGPNSLLVKMQEAAVAAGRRTLEDHDG